MTAAGHGGPAPVVLVPLDGSTAARSALPVAHTLARHLGASVHLVHVSDPALPAAEIDRRFDAGRVEVVHAASGDPAAAILAAARGGATVV
ncbi:MAG: universal stress protein, partial [Myxococcota bacterium]